MSKLAYTAGLIDGEGSIGLAKHGTKSPYRWPYVSMTNTSKELIDFMLENYGGSVSKHKVYKEHHKQSWVWRLAGDKAIGFVSRIFPHLLEERKRYRSRLLIEEYKKVTPRNGRYSDEKRKQKLAFEQAFFTY